jgi:hypothetical protein
MIDNFNKNQFSHYFFYKYYFTTWTKIFDVSITWMKGFFFKTYKKISDLFLKDFNIFFFKHPNFWLALFRLKIWQELNHKKSYSSLSFCLWEKHQMVIYLGLLCGLISRNV